MLEQEYLGCGNFLQGCISAVWQEIQQQYYFWIGSRQLGGRWAVALIMNSWDVAWDQWEHRNTVLYKEFYEELRGEELTLNIELTWEFKIGPLD